MDFSLLMELIKLNLNIDNSEICRRLNIGEITLENYISGYASPSEELLQKTLAAFSLVGDFPKSILCPDLGKAQLPMKNFSAALRGAGRFFTAVPDSSMESRRIFKGDYALIEAVCAPVFDKVLLLSADGADAALRFVSLCSEGICLASDAGKTVMTEEEFSSRVRVAGRLLCTISADEFQGD